MSKYMSKPVLVIAAISARPYVQAAVNAGFEVIALDAFSDVDTQKLAQQCVQVKVKNGQFLADKLLNALENLSFDFFCYGAGFEAQPELLAQIEKRWALLGNSAKTVQMCKDPSQFFGICKALSLPFPEFSLMPPTTTKDWLQKNIGGSGGAHIKVVLPLDLPADDAHFFQKIQAGAPVSCFFLADGKQVQIIGFNLQWCSPTLLLPYRFGGAVSHADLPKNVQEKIEVFISKATPLLGLRGLNSADFLLQDDDLFALEINPRLSATLDCYRAKKGDLFAAHIATCQGESLPALTINKAARAMQIVYANQPILSVPPDLEWPDFVRDIPTAGSLILAGEPICSVLAEARTPKLAQQKALQMAASLS